MLKVTFMPGGASVLCPPDTTIMEAAAKAGAYIPADCRGNGSCGGCRVRIVSGELTPASVDERFLIPKEELKRGVRLACRAVPVSDCVIALVSSAESTAKGNVRLSADFIPDAMGPGRYSVAFDIGTTTVAGMLCDMATGAVSAAVARANPEGAHGADVISRIEYCMNDKEGLVRLNALIIACLDDIAGELAATAGIEKNEICSALAVGNTTMTHILFNTDPSSLARAPFEPRFILHEPADANAAGLHIAPGAKLSMLPNIASHVGADITGAILASRMCDGAEPSMLIDIGTNGEMAFYAKGRLAVCSTAAGPAFEGAAISCGMRAAPGAITRAGIGPDGDIELETVAGAAPCGICGSGLIDAAASLADAGVIDRTGRIIAPDKAVKAGVCAKLVARIRQDGRVHAFALTSGGTGDEIVLTQRDVREIQLAKAAITAGRKLVMRELGIEDGSLRRVMLAGAFGSHIRPRSAMRIGLIPVVPLSLVEQLGNAAGAGACMALMSGAEELRAQTLAAKAIHIELAAHPDFQNEFINAMGF